jgi:hypothetical protein
MRYSSPFRSSSVRTAGSDWASFLRCASSPSSYLASQTFFLSTISGGRVSGGEVSGGRG